MLKQRGLALETLSVEQGIEAMIEFYTAHRPQHGDPDTLDVSWLEDRLVITRRMMRSDNHTPRALVLTFCVDKPRGDNVTDRRLELLG